MLIRLADLDSSVFGAKQHLQDIWMVETKVAADDPAKKACAYDHVLQGLADARLDGINGRLRLS